MRAGPYLAAAFTSASNPAELYSGGYKIHARLIRAIGRRDPEAAVRALALDLTTAARWYVSNGVVTEPDAASAAIRGRPSHGRAAARSNGKALPLNPVGT